MRVVCDLDVEFSALLPKVTDFGLAKRLDKQGQTVTGAILGTAPYMAPEQARGKKEVGPAADVYSLGAILYECLTGRPPFRGATLLETLTMVTDQEPVPPRLLRPEMPRDVQTVCLKCLAKEPQKRYASAAELADDLHRLLVGEPIRARPVGWAERAWKWSKQRPGVLAVSALFAFALGALGVNGYSARLERERARGESAVIARVMEEMFQRLADGRLPNEAGASLLRFYLQVVEKSETPEDLGKAYHRVGEIARIIGRKETARHFFTLMEKLYRGLRDDLGADHPKAQPLRVRLAEAQVRLGELAHASGDWDTARTKFGSALRELRGMKEPDHLLLRAEAHHLLADLYATQDRKDLRRALVEHDKALAIRRQLVRERGDQRYEYKRDLARSYGYIGDVWRDLGNREEAEDAYWRSAEIREELAKRYSRPTNPHYRDALHQLARSYWNSGALYRALGYDVKLSRPFYEKAQVHLRVLVREFPHVSEHRSDLSWVSNRLGELYIHEGNLEEAKEHLARAQRGFERLCETNPKDLDSLRGLACAHTFQGKRLLRQDPAAANDHLKKARAILEGRELRRHVDGDDLYNLALIAALHGHDDQALKTLDRARGRNFNNAAQVKAEPAFARLQGEESFQTLLAALKSRQR